MNDSDDKIQQRFHSVLREIVLVEDLFTARLAALRSEMQALQDELGLTADDPGADDGEPLDLPFRRPLALVSPIAATNQFVFPGWRIGAGNPDAKCSVQQIPAPESALTYPGYRLVVSLRRDDDDDCGFLSVELDLGDRGIEASRYCDVAVRLRCDPTGSVSPVLRIFSAPGEWEDVPAPPLAVERDFRSFATTFDLSGLAPTDPGFRRAARLIYFLPADRALQADFAYVVVGFRRGAGEATRV